VCEAGENLGKMHGCDRWSVRVRDLIGGQASGPRNIFEIQNLMRHQDDMCATTVRVPFACFYKIAVFATHISNACDELAPDNTRPYGKLMCKILA